jgi:hypothetical protein
MSESGRIPDTHGEAWALLPFLVNGRLSDEDREWVEFHVSQCEDCQRELQAQRPLAAEMRDAESPVIGSEQRAFNKLWTRIEAAEGAVPGSNETPVVSARSAPSRTVRWLAAAAIVQAVGLGVLGLVALQGRGEDFRTVTDVPAPVGGAAAVRLVFAPDTQIDSMAKVLGRYGLQIVSGPGQAGVFTAALPASTAATPASVAASLANDPHIRFAEPVAN